MADLIRRSDVIGLLEDMLLFGEYDIISSSFSKADEEKAYMAINDIPAVNLWIPCSERLPEDGVNVNITWVNKTISDDKFVGTALRLDGVWYWYPPSSRFLVEIDEECGIEVLAWMPMPNAYEPPEKE